MNDPTRSDTPPPTRRVVELQAQHRRPGQDVANDFQTNGTLLNEDWAAFLRRNRFLVGLSVDGPAHLHDRYRTTRSGYATHAAVVAAASLLQRHDVPFNTLCVVNLIARDMPQIMSRVRRESGMDTGDEPVACAPADRENELRQHGG